MFANLVAQYGKTFLEHAQYVRDDQRYIEDQTERVKDITYKRPIVAIVLTSLVLVAAIALAVVNVLQGHAGLTFPHTWEWMTTLGNYNYIIVGVSGFASLFIMILASRELNSRIKEKERVSEVDKAYKLLQPKIDSLFEHVASEKVDFNLESMQFHIHDNKFYYKSNEPLLPVHASNRELGPQEIDFLTKYFEAQGYKKA